MENKQKNHYRVSTVNVPQDKYDELLYRSALVDILHHLYKTSNKYAVIDLVEWIFNDLSEDKNDLSEDEEDN